MKRREVLIGSGVVGFGGVLQLCGLSSRLTRPFKRSKPVANWVTYPGDEWEIMTPQKAGFDVAAWQAYLAAQNPQGAADFGEDHSGMNWGTVLTRGGYLIHSWGDPDYRYQSASVGKAFTKMALQIAIDQQLIESENAPVMDYWIGDGRAVEGKGQGTLSHPHKYLNQGHHTTLTFAHLASMTGGFEVSNGDSWPGDPLYDNYAINKPGSGRTYSSGGMWRLTQALTYIFQKSLKTVLDETIFGEIGIRPENWYWLPGEHVFQGQPVPEATVDRFYPDMPNYGAFVDPPYQFETDNGVVQAVGGGGWAGMTPKDLARVGLLIATRGMWRDKRLISDTWLLDGHAGGNSSDLTAWEDPYYISWAQVTTQKISKPNVSEIVVSPPITSNSGIR